jgi:formylglycine-generating enzyme required for sulfatase activity
MRSGSTLPFRAAAIAAMLACALLESQASIASSFDWVSIAADDAACDVPPQGCFGAVSQPYRISRYEVTCTEYAAFLQDVPDVGDPHALFDPRMSDTETEVGCISRGGSDGAYVYDAIAGRGDRPANYVSWEGAARYVNWLETGSTESGVYDMSDPAPERTPGASFFLPSEDEWYRAAYYHPGSQSYSDYPVLGTMTCSHPSDVITAGNCFFPVSPFEPFDVGSYPNAKSDTGTLDQGGNVWEWVDTPYPDGRIIRGGSFQHDISRPKRNFQHVPLDADFRSGKTGLRVAPEPGADPMLALGALTIAGLSASRRRRRR